MIFAKELAQADSNGNLNRDNQGHNLGTNGKIVLTAGHQPTLRQNPCGKQRRREDLRQAAAANARPHFYSSRHTEG